MHQTEQKDRSSIPAAQTPRALFSDVLDHRWGERGAKGIEQIYQIKLTEEEKGMLAKSAASVQELVDILKTKI